MKKKTDFRIRISMKYGLLFHRDPNLMVYEIIPTYLGKSPKRTLNNQGFVAHVKEEGIREDEVVWKASMILLIFVD